MTEKFLLFHNLPIYLYKHQLGNELNCNFTCFSCTFTGLTHLKLKLFVARDVKSV